ncbi:calcineurin-like phosphoesterase family protein [Methanomicrobium sp. W14]|uniref:metallophosphoesterase n=1 Tax=Methanomicrobium sp. W14 TaxID=2817839 RepID=UPI001AE272C3|nr:metallophosphoesterase [Methanomicrobium sp. W14]MBP2132728.1 calcineurin-like phosphoesterase family protein [Methanomicrobium sp. W14]
MQYNVTLSLNLSPALEKFSDRIEEIKSAAPYFKFPSHTEIELSDITLPDKDRLKTFLKAVENSFDSIDYLSFNSCGWRKNRSNNISRLYFSVEPLNENSDIAKALIKQIAISGLKESHVMINSKNYYDIPAAESKGIAEFKNLWSVTGGKNELFSKILSKTVFAGYHRPLYSPRILCLHFDVLFIDIRVDKNVYKTFSIPCKEWLRPKDDAARKKAFEKYRILKGYHAEVNSDKKKEEENKSKIYLCSDLHLGHTGIISSAARPFIKNDTKTMDNVLISNWNNTIGNKDSVIFTGDLTYGQESKSAQKCLDRLNGNIIFVKGNHDTVKCSVYDNYELRYKGYSFFFIHDPKKAPENYKGWIVHGHTHNSRMNKFPFIDFEKRHVNISCELTKYCPIEIDKLVKILDIYKTSGYKQIYSLDEVHQNI